MWVVCAAKGLPIVPGPSTWDERKASEAIFKWAGFNESNPDSEDARKGFLYFDSGNPSIKGSYHIPFCVVRKKKLYASREGLAQARIALNDAHVPDYIKTGATRILDLYQKRIDKMTESTKAAGSTTVPDSAWQNLTKFYLGHKLGDGEHAELRQHGLMDEKFQTTDWGKRVIRHVYRHHPTFVTTWGGYMPAQPPPRPNTSPDDSPGGGSITPAGGGGSVITNTSVTGVTTALTGSGVSGGSIASKEEAGDRFLSSGGDAEKSLANSIVTGNSPIQRATMATTNARVCDGDNDADDVGCPSDEELEDEAEEQEDEYEVGKKPAKKSMLANFLRDRINQLHTPTRLPTDLVTQMSRASGLSVDRVNQLIAGGVYPVSPAQLGAMAATLGVYPETLLDLHGRDASTINRGDQTSEVASNLIDNLFVSKDANGEWRWTLISSTSYRDRDNEIVSQKALADDVARADAFKDYGPLLWWHSEKAVLGTCDFNCMTGPGDRYLLESGVFDDPIVAEAVAKNADKLGVSIGFLYDPAERTADGVFPKIIRKERSILPAGKASNRFTCVSVTATKEADPTMNATKYNEFLNLFPTPEAGHQAAMRIGQRTVGADQLAQGLGVEHKEAKLEATTEEKDPTKKGDKEVVVNDPAIGMTVPHREPEEMRAVVSVEELGHIISAQMSTMFAEWMKQVQSVLGASKEAAQKTDASTPFVPPAQPVQQQAQTGYEELIKRLEQQNAAMQARLDAIESGVKSVNLGVPPAGQMAVADARSSQSPSTLNIPATQQAQGAKDTQQVALMDPFITSIFG